MIKKTDDSLNSETHTGTSTVIIKFNMLTPIQAQHATTDIYKILTLQPEVLEILQEQKKTAAPAIG